MSYIDPHTVLSPEIASGPWTSFTTTDPEVGRLRVRIDRFPTDRNSMEWQRTGGCSGNPQSRGRPTWFIVPDELSPMVRDVAERLSNAQEGGLLATTGNGR